MSREKIGKVALTPKGEYKSGTQYEPLDVITHSGKAYVVLSKVKGVTPSSDGENYQVLVSDGYTPKRGTDYWTDEDVANVVRDVSEQSKAIVDKEAEAKKNSVLGSIPDDYTALSRKVNNASNALKGTASGEAIGLHDISPLEHTMAVKLKSKNVVSIADKTISGDKGYSSGSINGISLTPNTVYTLSVDFTQTGSNATVGISVRDSSGTTIGRSDTTTDTNGRLSATFTAPTDGKIVIVFFSNITATAIKGTSCVYSNFQIEEGTTATAYAPYVADVSVASVKTYGANTLPYPYSGGQVPNGATWTDNGDGTITANGTPASTADSYFRLNQQYKTIKGVTYRLSGCPSGGGSNIYRQYVQDNETNATYADVGNGVEFVGTGNTVRVIIQLSYGTTANNLTFKPMLSVGSGTDYEPYKEPVTYTPNADGTIEGVSSLYPSTTLLTDTEGVVVDCEYNRDINKAFAELQQAIISLGGNV